MDVSALVNAARAFANNFIPFLLSALCVVVGLVMLYGLLQDLVKKASGKHQHDQAGFGALAGRVLIAGLMLRLGPTMNDVSSAVFGSDIQDYRGVMAYVPMAAQAGIWGQVFEVCLLWVVMIGWAGAFRGLLLLHKATAGGGHGGGDHFWQALWHLVGGAAAINMTGVIRGFFSG